MTWSPVGKRDRFSLWQMWTDGSADPSGDRETEAVEADGGPADGAPAPALGERLWLAHEQRRLFGGEGVTDNEVGPCQDVEHEMLQFVVALDERSLVSRGVFAGVAPGGPLPRRRPAVDAEVSAGLVVDATGGLGTRGPAVVSPPGECPNCGGRRLRVDELDLDAATCVRSCADCSDSFTSPI